MNGFTKHQRIIYKIKAIFVPSMIVWAGLTISYSLLYLLIFVWFGLFQAKAGSISVIIGFLLSGTAEFIWIVPRLKLLNLNSQSRGSRNQLKSIYIIYLWLILTLPMIAITGIISFLGGLTDSLKAGMLSIIGLPVAGIFLWLLMVILPAFDQNELKKILDLRK